jgi:Uma2 family endonuclease
MATHTIIPVSEYLTTAYSPDCDYVDGEVQERNLGEQDHSDLQTQFAYLLRSGDGGKQLRINTELRVQVRPSRFRVPDVCVRLRTAPSEQIIRTPPLLCIEILSPEDRAARMQQKIRDYLDMGVREVWIADPSSRTVMVHSGANAVERASGELVVPGTPVEVSLADAFSVLDEY